MTAGQQQREPNATAEQFHLPTLDPTPRNLPELSPSLWLVFCLHVSSCSTGMENTAAAGRDLAAMISQRDTVKINTMQNKDENLKALDDGVPAKSLHNGGNIWKNFLFPSSSLPHSSLVTTIPCFYFGMINKVCKHREAPEVRASRPAGRRKSGTAVIRPAAGSRPARDNDVIVAEANWPVTGDEQTDGEQSRGLGQ